jgi:hypothetical protein
MLACIYKLYFYNYTNDDTNDIRFIAPFNYYCLYITMTLRPKLLQTFDIKTNFASGFVNFYLFCIFLNEANKCSHALGNVQL